MKRQPFTLRRIYDHNPSFFFPNYTAIILYFIPEMHFSRQIHQTQNPENRQAQSVSEGSAYRVWFSGPQPPSEKGVLEGKAARSSQEIFTHRVVLPHLKMALQPVRKKPMPMARPISPLDGMIAEEFGCASAFPNASVNRVGK